MMYKIAYITMLISYAYLSFQSVDLKTKILGILLTIVNGIIFWKG